MLMHSKKQAQIKVKAQVKIQAKTQVRALIFDEAFIIVLTKYFDYNNVFLVENIVRLSKYTGITNYTIKLEKNKQIFFGSIYCLKPIKLEILKIYIEINITNNFIRLFKFFAKRPIFFD